MHSPRIASNIERYQILDTPPEQVFDELARRAAHLFAAPMAGISFFIPSLVASPSGAPCADEWFKSVIGLPDATLASEQSFFLPVRDPQFAAQRTFAIPDLLADKRFRDHQWVGNPPYITFYAGAAVLAADRTMIGVLSVFDTVARQAEPRELQALINLADLVSARLEARAAARRARAPAVAQMTEAQIEQNTSALLTEEFTRMEQLLEDEIAERQAAERKLREEKAFSDAAIESLPGAFFMFDANARMVRWNASFQRVTGFPDHEIATRRALDFIASHDRANVADAIRRVIERGDEVSVEADMRGRDGGEAPYSFHGRRLEIGGERYCIGVGRDITERLRVAREISHAKERLDLALMGSSLAIWDWDLTTNEVFFNEGWKQLVAANPPDSEGVVFPGDRVVGWNHAEDQDRFRAALVAAAKQATNEFVCEYRVPGLEGDWIWLQSKGKVTERTATGKSARMTGTTANITKQRAAEERAEFLATRDPLTGLPNRALLNDRLVLGIANAARKNTRLAFMFIDLDRFKTINDSLGHDVGDALLKHVAARLSACVRSSDTVARLGGDEFAVILENLPQEGDEAQQVAEKMIASLAAPILINNQPLNTSCSVGIGVYPSDGIDAQTLMKHADVAMYDAKAKGRNNYQFFSHQMNSRAQERLSIENFLRLALRRNELVLHYQPRVSITTGRITGVEALVRWQHPRRGLLAPDKFISVAEDSGLIVPIGEWVIAESFRQLAQWKTTHAAPLTLAVNLSAGQIFNGARLVTAIEAAGHESGIDLHQVEFELTESALLKSSEETAVLLKRLGELGIGLAIDDFGTGYSSLSYLKQLPVDAIKIDSSFVRDIGSDPNDEAIIRAIIAMSHSLKLNVIAEGVERPEQLDALRALGCDEYQGFLFAKPMAAEAFGTMLAAQG